MRNFRRIECKKRSICIKPGLEQTKQIFIKNRDKNRETEKRNITKTTTNYTRYEMELLL